MGKTETMLFGTSKRMNLWGRELNMFVNGTCINSTYSSKYLGIDQDPNQNVRSYFDKTYKRAAGRVNRLKSICPSIDQKCTERIYNTMIRTIYFHLLRITWSCLVRHPKKPDKECWTTKCRIIGNSSLKHPSVENTIKCKSGQLVFGCLLDNLCSPFKSYFERLDHFKSTRKDGFSVKLPKVRLEFGKKGFYYQGA